jgi:hypothetical protein
VQIGLKTQLVNKFIQQLHKYKALPTPTILFKRQGSQEDINLKNMNLSKPYVSAFGSSVKDLKLKSLTLSGIRRNETGISKILKNLPVKLQKLDLSGSSVGPMALHKLYIWLKDNHILGSMTLRHLNLSNNKIGDQAAFEFFTNLLLIDVDLLTLNLSKN